MLYFVLFSFIFTSIPSKLQARTALKRNLTPLSWLIAIYFLPHRHFNGQINRILLPWQIPFLRFHLIYNNKFHDTPTFFCCISTFVDLVSRSKYLPEKFPLKKSTFLWSTSIKLIYLFPVYITTAIHTFEKKQLIWPSYLNFFTRHLKVSVYWNFVGTNFELGAAQSCLWAWAFGRNARKPLIKDSTARRDAWNFRLPSPRIFSW